MFFGGGLQNAHSRMEKGGKGPERKGKVSGEEEISWLQSRKRQPFELYCYLSHLGEGLTVRGV